VENDRLLVAVDRAVEHRGVAGFEPPVAQFVAGAGAFDLDHLGAEVREHPPGGGCGDVIAEFEDSHTGKGKSVRAHDDAPSCAWFGSPMVPGAVPGFPDIRIFR